jgi:cyclophilin family peptidyl-prolyl cis-trans isomerase
MDRNDSRFIITAVEDAPRLDGEHIAFGGKGQGRNGSVGQDGKKDLYKEGTANFRWSLIKIRYALYLYNRRTLIYT